MPTDGRAFDALLLSEARLGVISVLMARKSASFSELRELLGLTQGNLGVHLRKLEDGRYVKVDKAFVERRPRTTCRITARGRKAFLDHVEHLTRIAEGDGNDD
jgi:DNA-binding MarR family transcriptional regulator